MATAAELVGLIESLEDLADRAYAISTPEQPIDRHDIRIQSAEIGRQLALAAAARGMEHEPYDRLAVYGYAGWEGLLIPLQSLRTVLEIELTSNGTPRSSPGRPASNSVAKRRRKVAELRDEGMTAGDIAAALLELQQQGKLPKDLPVGVQVVEKDMKRTRPRTK